MIELIDNSLQLAVTLVCALWTSAVALRRKSQVYFMLACFYATFAMGLLYWISYLVVNNYTPKLFYVPELSWMASYLFLLMLCQALPTAEERTYRPALAWLAPLITIVAVLYFIQFGEYFANITWCSLLAASGWLSIRGLLWGYRQSGWADSRCRFYALILLLILLEYLLWTASCNWMGDTLANPYYWIDCLITVTLAALPAAFKRVVRA